MSKKGDLRGFVPVKGKVVVRRGTRPNVFEIEVRNGRKTTKLLCRQLEEFWRDRQNDANEGVPF